MVFGGSPVVGEADGEVSLVWEVVTRVLDFLVGADLRFISSRPSR